MLKYEHAHCYGPFLISMLVSVSFFPSRSKLLYKNKNIGMVYSDIPF